MDGVTDSLKHGGKEAESKTDTRACKFSVILILHELLSLTIEYVKMPKLRIAALQFQPTHQSYQEIWITGVMSASCSIRHPSFLSHF